MPLFVRTVRQVADAFRVERDTVQKEWRPAGMPGRPGKFDLEAIGAWQARRRLDLAVERVGEAVAELKAASRLVALYAKPVGPQP